MKHKISGRLQSTTRTTLLCDPFRSEWQLARQNLPEKSRQLSSAFSAPLAQLLREERGQYRVAAGLWLKCMDKACGEVERARIAVRRQRCIGFSNGLRRGEYSGISAGCGVIYD